jgi:Flp pilus assembly protein TadG
MRNHLPKLRRHFARHSRLLARFFSDTHGNIAVMFALMLPVLLGVTGLVVEYGHSLTIEADNQRTADLAAYAGALAYSNNNSSTSMVSAGKRVGQLNGVDPAGVALELVDSPRDPANKAVRATITEDKGLFLAPILGVSNTVRIVTVAYAELGAAGTSGCIIALDQSKAGLVLSGGTKITAPTCAVATNSKIEVPCGTSIEAKQVSYNSNVSQPCNGITTPSLKKAPVTDPLSGNASVAVLRGRIATVAAMTSPGAPTFTPISAPTGGFNIEFAYNDSSTISQASAAGCTASKSGSVWSLTCPQGANRVYNFGKLSVGGGLTLNFNVNGNVETTYNISGSISTDAGINFGPGNYTFGSTVTTSYGATSFGNGVYRFTQALNIQSSGAVTFGSGTFNFAQALNLNASAPVKFGNGTFNAAQTVSISGASVTFGAGTFNFKQGMTTSGGVAVSFGAGTFNFGRSANSCNSSTYSLCHNSSGGLTIDGPSTFNFEGGISVGGGATLRMGNGSTNVFKIGAGGSGHALYLLGGSKTYLADATTFELGGNLSSTQGGGSCLVISKAAQHDIRGYFDAAGAVIMGAGIYTIDGYFALGASGGGGGTCNNQSVSVKAQDVNIVISGKTTPTGGNCSGQAFCVGAGYSGVELTAPTTGPYANLAVIGPASITAGASFIEGGSGGKISGTFYFPVGAITMSGGAGVAGGTTCLQLIGSQITLSGGTTAASECVVGNPGGSGTGGGGSGSSRPRLVQ